MLSTPSPFRTAFSRRAVATAGAVLVVSLTGATAGHLLRTPGASAGTSGPGGAAATTVAAVAPSTGPDPAVPSIHDDDAIDRAAALSPRPPAGAARLPGRASHGTPTASGDLSRSFDAMRARLGVRSVGLAFAPLGAPRAVTLGAWESGAAWSTIKVPLSMAALGRSTAPDVVTLVHRAVTESDNTAAERLWASLGGGQRAAAAVNAVLTRFGDRLTRTQARRVRPPFTPFGQTTWSLPDQVTFVESLYCSPSGAPVVAEMSRIASGQRWGLGGIRGAVFKGGWGPDLHGRYLVRQFGIVRVEGHHVAVAVAVEPRSGSFADGTRALDTVTRWVSTNLHPASGACP